LIWLKKSNGSFKNHGVLQQPISGGASGAKRRNNQSLLQDKRKQQQQPNLNIEH
jgi:hypothetical protein